MSRSRRRMILPERVFGRSLGPDDPLRPGEFADPLGDDGADLLDQLVAFGGVPRAA